MSYQSFKVTFNLMGAALVITGLAALASPVAQPWFAWTTVLAGALCWIGSASTKPGAPRKREAGGLILSAGIITNGLLGWSVAGLSWLIWWNCIAGVAGMIASLATKKRDQQVYHDKKFKRAA